MKVHQILSAEKFVRDAKGENRPPGQSNEVRPTCRCTYRISLRDIKIIVSCSLFSLILQLSKGHD